MGGMFGGRLRMCRFYLLSFEDRCKKRRARAFLYTIECDAGVSVCEGARGVESEGFSPLRRVR